MIKQRKNANADVIAIGGAIATVGVGAQIPALSGVTTWLISSVVSSGVCSAAVGASIATSALAIVNPIALIGVGAALVINETYTFEK